MPRHPLSRHIRPDPAIIGVGGLEKRAFLEVGDAWKNIKRHAGGMSGEAFYDNVLEGVPAIAGRVAQPVVAAGKLAAGAAIGLPLLAAGKVAQSFWNVGKGAAGAYMKDMAKVTAAGVLFAGGAGLGGEAIQKGRDVLHSTGSSSRYKAMLSAYKDDPTMHEVLSSKEGRAYFGVLDRAAPSIAAEPLLAGRDVVSMVSMPAASGSQLIERAVNVDTKYSENKKPFAKAKVDVRAPGGF